MHAWRESTHKQYRSSLTKWLGFSDNMNSNPFKTSIVTVLKFLTDLHKQGLSYSAINTARSALSAFVQLTDGQNIGSHPLVTKFMKGVFNIKPPMPRYKQIWDVKIVLNLLRTWSPVKRLSLKLLTLKLCMMLALLGATRTQLLKALCVNKLQISGSNILFNVDKVLKTNRQGKPVGQELTFTAYPPDRRLCILKVLKQYLRVTQDIRGTHSQLLLSYIEPHAPVETGTIARWIREVMAMAGIDVNIFKAHSVRTASVSAAGAKFVPIQDIVDRAGWSSEHTFQRFYNKPIQPSNRYQDAILS